MELRELTFEKAKELEGTTFLIELPEGESISLKLDEVLPFESRQRRRSRTWTPKRAPFSLYFLGPVQPILPQAIYTFRSEAATFEKLFIVPIGQDAQATEYEAVFT